MDASHWNERYATAEYVLADLAGAGIDVTVERQDARTRGRRRRSPGP